MVPEGHGCQVLPDPHLGSKSLLAPGGPCNFCITKFLPKCTAEAAPEAPHSLFMHPVPQGWGALGKKNQEPSPFEDHLCAKNHPDPSSILDFYREQTHTHRDIALYV